MRIFLVQKMHSIKICRKGTTFFSNTQEKSQNFLYFSNRDEKIQQVRRGMVIMVLRNNHALEISGRPQNQHKSRPKPP